MHTGMPVDQIGPISTGSIENAKILSRSSVDQNGDITSCYIYITFSNGDTKADKASMTLVDAMEPFYKGIRTIYHHRSPGVTSCICCIYYIHPPRIDPISDYNRAMQIIGRL
jgi:hypothetical protein